MGVNVDNQFKTLNTHVFLLHQFSAGSPNSPRARFADRWCDCYCTPQVICCNFLMIHSWFHIFPSIIPDTGISITFTSTSWFICLSWPPLCLMSLLCTQSPLHILSFVVNRLMSQTFWFKNSLLIQFPLLVHSVPDFISVTFVLVFYSYSLFLFCSPWSVLQISWNIPYRISS